MCLHTRMSRAFLTFCAFATLCTHVLGQQNVSPARGEGKLAWQEVAPIPNELGVAGPFVGVSNDSLVVAGGANFPTPVWENDKVWYSDIFAMREENGVYAWESAGKLPRPVGYGANVTHDNKVLCFGGNDANELFSSCFELSIEANASGLKSVIGELPDLPVPLAYGQACVINQTVYLAGGQTTSSLDSAVQNFWTLDLNALEAQWEAGEKWPAPPRAFNMTVAQNNGFDDCLYLIGGRYQDATEVKFLDDCWEYNPKTGQWRERASMPFAVTAGCGVAYGQSHILVLSGDDGKLFHRTDELKDEHPGFPRRTLAYHAITDTWVEMGESPANHVTTSAVNFDDTIFLPTGEVRPRIRSAKVWRIDVQPTKGLFGFWDYTVLFVYLGSLILIGVYFARKTKNTEDYFRGSGSIPWWAAGCSIFATMLSSLTFTGVPSKAFAQDWVYAVGNFMIPVVALVAVLVALPFFRKIDATSAYEYLEKRFNGSIRIFGSLCFSTFHVFRMAIVMSLTGLALAVATPLSPVQAVLLMGVLSIVYCTIGGISAVIWTDTLQTFVLLGGALVAIAWMLAGTGQDLAQSYATATNAGKLNMTNWHLSPFDVQVAFWAVIVGALGQNVSSYTADQAVVQRYMTTKTERQAANAIWTNAILAVPATVIFFGIGTALFLYYRANPERLDATITTDQIFPLFISRELPVGLSGLIVAAVFAAAQSTVSTSMNSVATTLVTDCIQPWLGKVSELALLRLAQVLTVLLGIAGTWIAISFVDPDIKSLFDEFIKVIGLFMGVLGGLFILGILFPRANSLGAWAGALCGAGTMFMIWKYTSINGYLYTSIGIATCVLVGNLFSTFGNPKKGIEELVLIQPRG